LAGIVLSVPMLAGRQPRQAADKQVLVQLRPAAPPWSVAQVESPETTIAARVLAGDPR